MKAIILKPSNGSNHLVTVRLPQPEINANEVLVKVQAISINPVDVKTAAGKGVYALLKEQQPLILGWDISGVVVASGAKVVKFKPDDEVFAMVNFPGHGKSYAEYVAVPQNQLAKKPSNISHAAAAASTLAALSVWQFLVHKAGIKAGDRLLVLGASGGVGHFAVQIAKSIGAYVIAVSSGRNRAFVLARGADEQIDYQSQDFATAATKIDIVLDTIGGDYIDRSLPTIKPGGWLITTPTSLTEEQQQQARAGQIQAQFFLVESSGDDMRAIAQLLEQGIIAAHISHSYSFDQMEQAHQQIASGTTVGKLVVML